MKHISSPLKEKYVLKCYLTNILNIYIKYLFYFNFDASLPFCAIQRKHYTIYISNLDGRTRLRRLISDNQQRLQRRSEKQRNSLYFCVFIPSKVQCEFRRQKALSINPYAVVDKSYRNRRTIVLLSKRKFSRITLTCFKFAFIIVAGE